MIDLYRLKSLLGDEESMVKKFLEIFQTQTPLQLKQLRAGVAENDWAQVAIQAHGIKGQCQYLGLASIAELALHIERLADEQREVQSIAGLAALLEEKLLTLIRAELS